MSQDKRTRYQTEDGRMFDVLEPFYLGSCDACGWVGSTEECGTDHFGDDSDVFCPMCFKSGADCGKVASAARELNP